MTVGHIAVCLALAAGFVCGQSDNKPEIRGAVTDPSLDIGVAGAEITLFEFLLDAEKTVVRTQIATTSTDTRGEFRFPLQHVGEYFVEVKKEGYSVPVFGPGGPPTNTGTRADVTLEHPSQDVRFLLTRLGEITGGVIDEDGNPIAGLRIGTQKTPIPSDFEPAAITNQDGSFTTKKLAPGEYLVRILPKAGDHETVTAGFSEDDLKIIDEDFNPAASEPVPVSGGASASVGTMTARKVPFYRVHLFVPEVICQPKENWMLSVIPRTVLVGLSYTGVPCGSDFLVRNLKPGSYWFAVRSDKLSRWALAAVEVTRENVEVSMPMMQSAELNGRIIAAEGAALPNLGQVTIMMRARLGAIFRWTATAPVTLEGKFVVRDLPLVPHDVSVRGLDSRYYVKELRYNSTAMADGMLTPAPGASVQDLEIVLDDKPGVISGSVRDGDKPVSNPFIVAVKLPFQEGDIPLSGESLTGDKDGKFQILGLPPGEYRVIALNKFVRLNEISVQILSRAEKVIVDRGSSKDVSLKLIDPSR